MNKVRIRVEKILEGGRCPFELKAGDEWIFEYIPPPGFCHWAFHTMFPFITALRFGGNIPWEEEKGVVKVCCPDPHNPVVFEIRRLEETRSSPD